jgi:hypothetical protein
MKKGIIYKNAKMKMQRPGRKVKGAKYAADLEDDDEKEQDSDNAPAKKPADIAQAMKRAKEGYSKKPRVKPQKKRQR